MQQAPVLPQQVIVVDTNNANEMMYAPYFRSSNAAARERKQQKKQQQKKQQQLRQPHRKAPLGLSAYFPSVAEERSSSLLEEDDDEDNVTHKQEDEDEDDDDDKSVHSAVSASSTASARFSMASTAKLLKMTASMPVVATKTVARKSFQAGAAVVQGTSQAVVRTGTAVGTTVATGGKALATGTTAVVRGSSKAIVGGTSAIVGGTSYVVKGSSKALVQGTSAIVGGTSAVVMGGSKAIVGGTSAVTKKTVQGIQRATSIRPGRASFRRSGYWSGRASVTSNNTKNPKASQNQWDVAMDTLNEILKPGSPAYDALSNAQRKSLKKVKKMLLNQGTSTGGLLSSPVRNDPVACVPMDLLQLEKQNQKRMLRRHSNASSIGYASISDRFMMSTPQDAASVQSDASYILQEYGGIRNPTALLLGQQSEEFDDDDDYDLMECTSTSDLSMSDFKDDVLRAGSVLVPSPPPTEEAEADGTTSAGNLLLGKPPSFSSNHTNGSAPPTWGSEEKKENDGASDVTKNSTTHTASSEALRNDGKKTLNRKRNVIATPYLPPPVVTITLNPAAPELKNEARMIAVPLEFQQLGVEKRRAVYELLQWESLAKWDYDVFDLDRFTGGNALLFMGWAILGAPYAQHAMARACDLNTDGETFVGYPFMDKLNIPPEKLIRYLRVIQQDYHAENPYHNAIHAADVLQTVHAMIQMALQTTTTTTVISDGSQGDEQREETAELIGFFVRCCPNHLKLFSILLAAVVHDVDHPGKNNAFHTKLRKQLAVIYNDKSVLENWHIAHAFSRMLEMDLLGNVNIHKPANDSARNKARSNSCPPSPTRFEATNNKPAEDNNFLCNASDDDFNAIRGMMIEAVLQTDMTKHFAIVTEVKTMLIQIEEEEESGKPIRHDDERTWTLLTFMLHQADISGQAKADPLFLHWSDRCQQEFFAQGDEEAALGVWPISPYCDRNTTNQAVAQTGFVEFVVQPSYHVLADYIPSMQEVVLPLIQENLEFWYDAAGTRPNQGDEALDTEGETLENVEEEDSGVTNDSSASN